MGNILGLVLVEFTLVVSVSVWFLCFLDDTNMSGGGMNQWYMKKNHNFLYNQAKTKISVVKISRKLGANQAHF